MGTPLRALLLEDIETDAELLLLELRRGGFDVSARREETEVGLQAALTEAAWDLILSDYTMPSLSAPEALALLKESGRDIPLIIISGTVGESVAVAAMRAGAADYVLKSNLSRLVPAVQRELREASNRREQRRAELAARRLAALVESSDDAILAKDMDGIITDWNPAAERLYGYEAAEAIGKNVDMLMPPDLQAEADGIRARLMCGEPTPLFDTIRLHKDGRRLHVAVSVSPIRNAAGAVMGASAIARDIAQRKRDEEALSSLHAALAHAVEGISRLDQKGCYVSVNPAYARILGCQPEELLGTSWEPTVHPDDRDRMRATYTAMLQTGKVETEARGLRKDGSVFTKQVVMVKAHSRDGEFVGHHCFMKDVTERNRLEEQLRQAQKMEAIGRLAGGVAHDFNNLLTVMIGYADLLMVRLADPPLRTFAEQIKGCGQRAAALTEQLLAFSRKQVVQPRSLDLNVVVGGTQKMLRRLLGEDIALATDLSSPPLPVFADPGQLDQVLLNLAVNARDAMPRGGRLTIATHGTELDNGRARRFPNARPGSYVVLSVSDTGCGMTPEVKAHIFEPFFTTKGLGQGTGLGLAMIYGVVEQAGGHIEVESMPGAGTTFRIYLPRCQQAVRSRPSCPGLRRVPQGRETVLLVEDDAGVRGLARMVLEGAGYRVAEATHGAEALRLAQELDGAIHLLLTDVVMPEMSGRQLAERLQAAYPRMKVLYVSGYTDDAVVRHGVLSAEHFFLQKPFAPEVLTRRVREILDR